MIAYRHVAMYFLYSFDSLAYDSYVILLSIMNVILAETDEWCRMYKLLNEIA